MRLFTAVDLPTEIVERLVEFQRKLKPLADLAWSPAGNFHITTKFLGEVAEDRVPEVSRALEGMAAREAIPVEVRGVGFFPNARAPRVFWAGIEAPESLGTLHRETDAAVAALGVPREEKPFRPHLTLARIRNREPLDAMTAAIGEGVTFGGFTADRQFLYVSRDGRYAKLSEHSFSS